jgi:hypothetical protein
MLTLLGAAVRTAHRIRSQPPRPANRLAGTRRTASAPCLTHTCGPAGGVKASFATFHSLLAKQHKLQDARAAALAAAKAAAAAQVAAAGQQAAPLLEVASSITPSLAARYLPPLAPLLLLLLPPPAQLPLPLLPPLLPPRAPLLTPLSLLKPQLLPLR